MLLLHCNSCPTECVFGGSNSDSELDRPLLLVCRCQHLPLGTWTLTAWSRTKELQGCLQLLGWTHVPHAPLQAVLAATDQQTFAALMEFVTTQHQRSLDAEAGARDRRQLPTALTFAGGVNSADHAKTFPTLAQLLRDQVGPANGCSPPPVRKRHLIAMPGQTSGNVLHFAVWLAF